MKKIFRIILVSGFLFVGLLIFAGVALKIYFTEERLRSLVLPPMSEVLGREVEVASLGLDLFSGIKVAGLVVKEADGETDFVVVKEFNLDYSLRPLLERRLEIGRVRIERPVIKVWRNRNGFYNFADLQFLQTGAESAKVKSDEIATGKVPPGALPLALVVQRCEITDAVFSFYDEMGEFPRVDLKANLKSRLDFGDLRPESVNVEGTLDFFLTSKYHSLTPQAQGTVKFDRRKIDYRVQVRQEQEECTLSGSVSEYLAKPAIIFNLDSPRLDLVYLAALGQKLSASGGQQTSEKPGKTVKPTFSPQSPPPVTVRGVVNIKQAVYENYKVENFTLQYQYEDALLSITDLHGNVADGSFTLDATVKPLLEQPEFQGNLSCVDLQMSALMAMAAPAFKDNLSGVGYGQFKFSGWGSETPVLKKSLTLEGEYGLLRGGINNLPLTRSLSQLLGLSELENIEISDLDANLRLKNGQLNLDGSWNGDQFSGRTIGKIGLDGSLELPLQLVFSQPLSAKMVKRYPWVKDTLNDKEEAAVGLRLSGTLSKPRLRMDEKQLQKQVEKKILEKLSEKLAEKEGESGNEKGVLRASDLLRQLLK